MPPLKIDSKIPALTEADKMGTQVQKLGLDWEEIGQVLYKVEEEWQELKEELAPGVTPRRERVEDELGDLLFSVAQLARHLAIDPEIALKKANKKFLLRVQKVENMIQQEGKNWHDFSFEQLEIYWDKAKKE